MQPSAAAQPSSLSAEMTIDAFWALLRARIDTEKGTYVKLVLDNNRRTIGIDDSSLVSELEGT